MRRFWPTAFSRYWCARRKYTSKNALAEPIRNTKHGCQKSSSDRKWNAKRKCRHFQLDREEGYHDYTSAALHSTVFAHYGYYEVKAKPMNSAGSSSFWFSTDYDGTQGKVTEIDVFEISGKSKGFENKYNMSLHAWKDGPRLIAYVDPDPKANEHLEVAGTWKAPWRLADNFHVYGVDWEKDEIKFYVDGVVVRSVENTRWHYPLRLIFDSETMPEWFGMPKDEDLPSTFSIEYVRAWKKKLPSAVQVPTRSRR
ncbi:MAG: family 16 glycosylhydrolase [Planctomycetota bacterium]